MRSYVVLFTVSCILSFALTPFIRRRAIRWGAVDVPGGRRIHKQPTPRLGGVAIYISFVLTLLLVPTFGNMVSDTLRDNLPKLLLLFAPATLIFLCGIYDDLRGASAWLKVFVQAGAGTAVYLAGFGIDKVAMPFAETLYLPGIVGYALTLLWIIGITNAFNLIDGIDGLAAGASVFAMLSILFFSITQGHPHISLVAVVLVGATLGFLRYNFNPATIFLGDSGSLFLGFMAAVLSMTGSQKGSTIVAIAIPLVSFGLPVTEAGLSLVRRFLSGKPLLDGDRGHIHHMLLRRGLTQRQAVILLYGVCGLFSLFGLMLLNPERSLAALIFFVLGVGIIFGVQHLRYAEFSELGYQLRQAVTRGRRQLAVNVHLRRVGNDLAEHRTLDEIFRALGELLSVNEFDCAMLEVSQERCVAKLVASASSYGQHNLRVGENNRVVWIWERGDTPLEEILSTDVFWTLRLPLTDKEDSAFGAITFYRCLLDGEPAIDLKNICGPLQRELSGVLAYVLQEQAEEKIASETSAPEQTFSPQSASS